MFLEDKIRNQLEYVVVGGKKFLRWEHRRMYLDSKQVVEVTEKLAQIIADNTADKDCICPIPTSGIPIGVLVANYLKRSMLPNFGRAQESFKIKRRIPESTILVDSEIKTGRSFVQSLMKLDSIPTSINYLCVVLYNDMVDGEYVCPVKNTWFDSGKIIYLYRLSSLIK